MEAVATKKQQPPQRAAAASTGERPAVLDPKFEWAEKAGSYVLRLALPGFRKDGFQVQVDGAGRLTVRGTRPGTAGTTSLCKVFQLPSTASLDDIAGRFQAGVLTLAVPKHAEGAGVAAPTSFEEIKRKMPGVAKESKPKEEDVSKEDASKKKAAMEEATNKADEKEEEAQSRKKEQQKPVPSPEVKKEEELGPKAPHAAATTSPPEKPATKPEAATGADKDKTAVATDTVSERVKRRGEEDGANAAAKRTKMDGEKKATAACIGWKERVQGEMKAVTDMKWADGMVEAARKNKEVVAIGIAAISLGFLVCHKLFRK